ncbi:cytidine deaminase-like fold-containing protein [Amphritea atlantica]|nr:hypothetical protein [Amphritea atlantica]
MKNLLDVYDSRTQFASDFKDDLAQSPLTQTMGEGVSKIDQTLGLSDESKAYIGTLTAGLPLVSKLGKFVPTSAKPVVTAEARVNGSVFRDVNQTARIEANANKPTLISERVLAKEAKAGKELPNGNMGTAHAEIGAIQQAADAGKTKGADMSMTVSGKDVCGYCKGDIAATAEKAELKSLTIQATDDITGLPKTYHWKPGMKSIKVKP